MSVQRLTPDSDPADLDELHAALTLWYPDTDSGIICDETRPRHPSRNQLTEMVGRELVLVDYLVDRDRVRTVQSLLTAEYDGCVKGMWGPTAGYLDVALDYGDWLIDNVGRCYTVLPVAVIKQFFEQDNLDHVYVTEHDWDTYKGDVIYEKIPQRDGSYQSTITPVTAAEGDPIIPPEGVELPKRGR